MVKLKQPAKPAKIHREAEKVWRWNLCQKFAKVVYDSEAPTDELEAYFTDFENLINSNI